MGPKTKKVFRVPLPRFSLRTALIMFIFVGCGCGLVSRWYREVWARGQAQRAIVARFSTASPWIRPEIYGVYAKETNVGLVTQLTRDWVHAEYQRKFTHISASVDMGQEKPPFDLRVLFGVEKLQFTAPVCEQTLVRTFEIEGLKYLRVTVQADAEVASPVDWSVARKAQHLETLGIEGDVVRDALARELGKLPKLETVHITSCSPNGLAMLARAPALKELEFRLSLPWEIRSAERDSPAFVAYRQSLRRTFDALGASSKLKKLTIIGALPASRAELANFCEHSKIYELHLQLTRFDPDCLAEIAKLPNLEILRIDAPTLTAESLERLAPAKKLEWLLVGQTISRESIGRLQEVMPNCIIQRQ